MKKFKKAFPKLVSAPVVVGIGRSAESFTVRIEANASILGALTKISATLDFPIEELSLGASLARMMTLAMRRFVKSEQCRGLPPEDIRAFILLGPAATATLRKQVEPYFAVLALGERGV